MALEIASELDHSALAGQSTEERLQQVTEFLNQRGYLAYWEPVSDEPADGYLLHKCNCPYAGVASEHRELCLMDQTLVDELVGQPCRRTQSMAEHAHCCTYQVCSSTQSEIRLFEA
jgi:predicted ArsR family transcriptional regulator